MTSIYEMLPKQISNIFTNNITYLIYSYCGYEHYNIVLKHHEQIQDMIDYSKDKLFDFFGFKTLERAYLLRILASLRRKIN